MSIKNLWIRSCTRKARIQQHSEFTENSRRLDLEKHKKRIGRAVVVSAWLALFCQFGFRATFAVLKTPMAQDMGWSQAEVSLGYSIMMIGSAFMAFVCGIIAERHGAKVTYLFAAVFGGLGFCAASRVQSLWAYYLIFGVITGLGTGTLWATASFMLRSWFVGQSYAKMYGIAFSGAPVAQVALTQFVMFCLGGGDPSLWRSAVFNLGALIFVLLLVAAFLGKKTPKSYDMQPFGSTGTEHHHHEAHAWTLKDGAKTYAFWGLTLTWMFGIIAEFTVWTQIVSYWVSELDMAPSRAATLYGFIGFLGIIFMPLLGFLGDKFTARFDLEAHGRKRLCQAGLIAGILACICLLGQPAIPASLRFVAGIFSCALFAIYWGIFPGSVVGYLGSVINGGGLGRILGLCMFIAIGLGPAIGAYMGGLLRDIAGNYTASMIFALAAYAVGLIIATTLPVVNEHPALKRLRPEFE